MEDVIINYDYQNRNKLNIELSFKISNDRSMRGFTRKLSKNHVAKDMKTHSHSCGNRTILVKKAVNAESMN